MRAFHVIGFAYFDAPNSVVIDTSGNKNDPHARPARGNDILSFDV